MIKRNELLNNISTNYNLPKLKLNGKSKYGVTNSSYFLSSNNSKYVAKIYTKKNLNKIKKIDYLYNLSPKLNEIVPQIIYPLKNVKGKNFILVHGDFYIFLFEFVSGSHIASLNRKQITNLSLALKNFNKLANLIDNKSLFNIKKKSEYLENTDIEILSKKFKLNKCLYVDILSFLNSYKFKNNYPSLLHGDTDFTNYLFKQNKLVAILDLDDVWLGDQREEVIKTTLGVSFLRDSLTFSGSKAGQFVSVFKNKHYEKELIDYVVYKHIFSSQKTFINQSKVNDIILCYFNDMFNAYQKDKNNIYKAFSL